MAVATRRTRKDQWEALCRRSIQDAVVRLLCREGTGALTMEKVASEAGMAKGTLYLYFRDKRHLLDSVRQRSLELLGTELSAVLDGPWPVREKLARFVVRHLGFCEEHRDLLRVVLWERDSSGRQLKHRRSDSFRSLVDRVAQVLDDGAREGVLRPVDGPKVAAMLVESIIATITQRLLQPAPLPVEEDARMILDVFLEGLAARPGAGT